MCYLIGNKIYKYDVQSVMFEIKKQSKKGKYELFSFKVSKINWTFWKKSLYFIYMFVFIHIFKKY